MSLDVHTVNFAHRGGPAFYASLPVDGQVLKRCDTDGTGDKNRLVSILLDHVVAAESSLWKCRYSFDRAAFPIHMVRGPLGRPHLLLGNCRGPAISFSKGGGKIWAAICGDASDIGIDVAEANEFHGEYPLHRVFHDREFQHVLRLTEENPEKASALLWSIKEAAVKALGCAFHLVDPRQITVNPSAGEADESVAGENGGYIFPVILSRKAQMRFPIAAGRFIWVRSFFDAKIWLSIALLSRQS